MSFTINVFVPRWEVQSAEGHGLPPEERTEEKDNPKEMKKSLFYFELSGM